MAVTYRQKIKRSRSNEPKVRLPPIRVSPDTEQSLLRIVEETDSDVSNVARHAIEYFLEHEATAAQPETPTPNTVTLELDPELHQQLLKLAGTFGNEDLGSFVKHIAKRTAQLPDDTFTAFIAGKLETVVGAETKPPRSINQLGRKKAAALVQSDRLPGEDEAVANANKARNGNGKRAA